MVSPAYSQVAQLVEQAAVNRLVAGSSPVLGATGTTVPDLYRGIVKWQNVRLIT